MNTPTSHRGRHYRGYLPHRDFPVAHAITYRLADALPAEARPPRDDESSDDPCERLESVLDRGHGSCVLRDPEIARMVVDAWRFFSGVRYRLDAWVVMPNHVHLVIQVHPANPLERIVHSWKSYTAKAIGRVVGQRQVWQRDYWDRVIRDEAHWFAAVRYAHENPVRAGLARAPADWPWSSARREGIDDVAPLG